MTNNLIEVARRIGFLPYGDIEKIEKIIERNMDVIERAEETEEYTLAIHFKSPPKDCELFAMIAVDIVGRKGGIPDEAFYDSKTNSINMRIYMEPFVSHREAQKRIPNNECVKYIESIVEIVAVLKANDMNLKEFPTISFWWD